MTNYRLPDKVPVIELCQISGLKTIMDEVRKCKLKYLSSQAIFEGMMKGQVRPQRRWRDDIREWVKLGGRN